MCTSQHGWHSRSGHREQSRRRVRTLINTSSFQVPMRRARIARPSAENRVRSAASTQSQSATSLACCVSGFDPQPRFGTRKARLMSVHCSRTGGNPVSPHGCRSVAQPRRTPLCNDSTNAFPRSARDWYGCENFLRSPARLLALGIGRMHANARARACAYACVCVCKHGCRCRRGNCIVCIMGTSPRTHTRGVPAPVAGVAGVGARAPQQRRGRPFVPVRTPSRATGVCSA